MMEQRPDFDLTDPDAQPPARIPPVAEQILRFVIPVFCLPWTVTEDTE